MNPTEQIKKAFTDGSANNTMVHLREELAEKFIDNVVDESKLLKKIRIVKMNAPTEKITKLNPTGTFLHPATRGTAPAEGDRAQFENGFVQLTSKEVIGHILILDDEIRNVKEGDFGTRLLGLVAKKLANELENIALFGRYDASTPDCLHQFDGFIWKAIQGGQIVDATTYADRYVAKDKIVAGIKQLPTKYRPGLEILMPSDAVIDYGMLYDTVAQETIRNELRSVILGKPINEIPLFTTESAVIKPSGISTTVASGSGAVNTAGQDKIEVASASGISAGKVLCLNKDTAKEQIRTVVSVTSTTVTLDADLTFAVVATNTVKEVTLDGADTIITNPLNLIQGIQADMTFEPHRRPDLRGYIYYFTAHIDFAVEEAEAMALVRNMKVK